MTLGSIIKAYREEHSLSQRQFAAACELSNGYISMLEKNVNPKTGQSIAPSLLAIRKIAEVMHINMNDLLTQVDDMTVDLYNDTTIKKETLTNESKRMNEFCELFERLPEDKQSLIIHEIEALLT